MLMAFAVDREFSGVKVNPALGIKPLKMNPEGFHTWTEDEIEQFRARHPVGSKARLAFALMLCLAQRGRSDVRPLGRQHVRGEVVVLKQKKTGRELTLPIDDELAACLALVPRDQLTFLLTQHGKPYTEGGFGNWFKDQIKAAGLPDRCKPHGLRKAASRQLAEAGATEQEIKDTTGHTTSKEVSRYTRAARQELGAEAGAEKRRRAKQEQKFG